MHDVAVPMPAVPVRHELTVADLQHRQHLIQQVLKEIMVEGHHYGVIPGTDGKKSLLKSGAEKLCATFMLAPSFSVKERDMPNGHREYRADCTLTHISSGIVAGMATGSCSTMESKYRWRLASRKCPVCQADAIRKSKKGEGGFFCWSKIGGCGEQFEDGDRRIIDQPMGRTENPDLADQYNTVLKMATKRALVAATLVVTGASDMFVTEDDDEDDEEKPKGRKPEQKPTQRKEEPPPTDLTPKQRLLRDCVAMAEQLTKTGVGKQQITDALGQNGVVLPPKWGELAEKELEQVKQVFGELLKAGVEVGKAAP